jgi:hypothetical protein
MFKVFSLEGWTEFVMQQLDSGAFDMSLEQLYRAFWRRGAPSPWLAVTVLIVVSGIMYHMKNTGQVVVANGNNSLMSSLMQIGGVLVKPLMGQVGGGPAPGPPDFGVGYQPAAAGTGPAVGGGTVGGGSVQGPGAAGGGGGGVGEVVGNAFDSLAKHNMPPRASFANPRQAFGGGGGGGATSTASAAPGTGSVGVGAGSGPANAAQPVRVREPERPPLRRQAPPMTRPDSEQADAARGPRRAAPPAPMSASVYQQQPDAFVPTPQQMDQYQQQQRAYENAARQMPYQT